MKRPGWWLCGLLCCLLGAGCSDGDDSLATVSFADAPGALAVGVRTDVVTRDTGRERDITATYWYPTDGDNTGPEQASEGAPLIGGERRYPLVVLIHGIEDSAPATWPYLAPHLASHGYIVVAPSTGSTVRNAQDLVNHPGDVSFLLDRVLDDADPGNPLRGRIDADRVALGGFSFGAAAGYFLAYDPRYIEPRFKAVIIMAGGNVTPAPINPDLSLLAIFGTEDILIDYNLGLNIYEGANPPKYLVTLEGGGHVGFTSSNEVNFGASMEQRRQQALVRLSVFAFLTSVFDDRGQNRAAAREFLRDTLPAQNLDVRVFSAY